MQAFMYRIYKYGVQAKYIVVSANPEIDSPVFGVIEYLFQV